MSSVPVPFVLHADRVVVRDFWADDEEAFVQWAAHDEMYRWMKWRLNSREEALAMFTRLLFHPSRFASPRRHWSLAVLNEETEFIGTTGFDWRHDGTGEFGWYLAPSWWNRGYATEVTGLLLRFGFAVLGLSVITATCDPDNAASRRVLEKHGLEPIGEETIRTWTGPRPRLRMAIDRESWDTRNNGKAPASR